LNDPVLVVTDPNFPDRVRAYKGIVERGGRILRVVYFEQEKDWRVISAFLDRDAQRFIDSQK
jgi:hypothetical protein